MSDLVTLPDAEALTIEALLACSEVTDSALGTRVYSVVPKARIFPLARVALYGGDVMFDGNPYWLDRPSLQVDVWPQGGFVEARGLSELLRAVCVARLPGVWSTGVISSATVTGIVQGFEATFEPVKPRYRFSVNLVIHPLPVVPE